MSDEGAHFPNVFSTGPAQNILHLPGTGHEFMANLKTVVKLVWEYGGEYLATCHGYITEGAQNVLKNGKDLHKQTDFALTVCRTAIVQSLVREWVQEKVEEFRKADLLLSISSRASSSSTAERADTESPPAFKMPENCKFEFDEFVKWLIPSDSPLLSSASSSVDGTKKTPTEKGDKAQQSTSSGSSSSADQDAAKEQDEGLEEDKSFRAYVQMWVTDIMPALSLMLKGQRQCNFVMFNAGRKALLPLLFTRGNLNYSPATLDDLLVFLELAPKEILKQRMSFFTFKGQGYDFKLEESNSNIKSALTQDTERSFQFASATRDLFQIGRATLFREMGMRDRKGGAQSLLSYSQDIEYISLYLRKERVLRKDPKRASVQRFDGTEMLPEADLSKLMTEGKRRIRSYVDGGFLAGRRPTFPPLVPVTETERAKKRRKKNADDEDLSEDEDAVHDGEQ